MIEPIKKRCSRVPPWWLICTTAVLCMLGTIGLLASSIWISGNKPARFSPTQIWVGSDWSISAQRGVFRDSYEITFSHRPALITNASGQMVNVNPPDITVLRDVMRGPRDASSSRAQCRVDAYGWPVRLYVVQSKPTSPVLERRILWQMLALVFCTFAIFGFAFGWITWRAFEAGRRMLRVPGSCQFCGYSRQASRSRICSECGHRADED